MTKNFTLKELTKSATADRLGINNKPNKTVLANLEELAYKILQPIRDKYGKPIIVTSGYRCPALNRAVGGCPTSQHILGQAADIRTVTDTVKDNYELFLLIQRMVESGEIKVG